MNTEEEEKQKTLFEGIDELNSITKWTHHLSIENTSQNFYEAKKGEYKFLKKVWTAYGCIPGMVSQRSNELKDKGIQYLVYKNNELILNVENNTELLINSLIHLKIIPDNEYKTHKQNSQ